MLKKILVITFSILVIISCSKKTSDSNANAWTEITPDTETTIEVWAWNIGANHLEDTIPSFNAKYPKIKVNVTEFGGPPALKQKLFVTLGGNSELPNYVQIEDPDIALITEQYHQYFLDLKDQMPEMKGKWGIMPIPALNQDAARASSSGGAGLSITATDPIKQAAALEFVKESLMNVDNQLMMYEKFSLFPSYLPAYDDPRFLKADDYFGDNFNKIFICIYAVSS